MALLKLSLTVGLHRNSYGFLVVIRGIKVIQKFTIWEKEKCLMCVTAYITV